MIFNIGTDLVSVKRIDSLISKNPKFIYRILTEHEIEKLNTLPDNKRANYVAKRFSAKEALAKALGTGIGRISFQDIAILNHNNGAPYYKISSKFEEILEKLANKKEYKLHLSITDDSDYAISYAIIEVF